MNQLTLESLFSNVFELYFKAHGMHWNVEGINFPTYHAFFGELYQEVYSSIDDLAEEIRVTGLYVPYGCAAVSNNLSYSTRQIYSTNIRDMLNDLSMSNKIVIEAYKKAFAECNDEGFKDFLAGRLDAHKKIQWKLNSCIKGLE